MNLKDVKAITIPDYRYELLEYIHFNGNDLIDTGYTPYSGMSFEIDCQWDSDGTNNRYNGHGRVVSNNRAFIGLDSSNKITYGIGAVSASYSNVDPFTRHKYKIVCSASTNGSFSIDETTVVSSIAVNYVNSDRGTMYIGGVYRNSTDYGYCYEKIYEARFYNAGALVWILKPCKRISDNKIGLLRFRVSGSSAGSVEFLASNNDLVEAGPIVSSTSTIGVSKIEDSNGNIIWGSQNAFPYRRLEYIKFSGAEYVDTNTTLPTGTTYKRLDIRLSLQKTNGWGSNGFDSTTNQRFYVGVNNSNNARFGVGSGGTTSSGFTLTIDKKYYWTLWFNNGSSNMTVADADTSAELWKSSTLSVTFASAPGKLYIGALNYNGVSNYSQEKVYYVRIASGSYSGILFQGIPCQRKSDGVCGLYDIQNNIFRPMQGTNITDAAAGPVIDEYWDLTA